MRRNLWIALLTAGLGGCCWEETCASVGYRVAPDPAFCREVVVDSECVECTDPPPPGIRPLETAGGGTCEGPKTCADLGFTVYCEGDYYVRPPSGC